MVIPCENGLSFNLLTYMLLSTRWCSRSNGVWKCWGRGLFLVLTVTQIQCY